MERDDFAISPGFWRGTREEFRIDQRQLAAVAGVPHSGVAGLETDGAGSLDLKLAVLEAFLCLCAGEDEAVEAMAVGRSAERLLSRPASRAASFASSEGMATLWRGGLVAVDAEIAGGGA